MGRRRAQAGLERKSMSQLFTVLMLAPQRVPADGVLERLRMAHVRADNTETAAIQARQKMSEEDELSPAQSAEYEILVAFEGVHQAAAWGWELGEGAKQARSQAG